MKLIYSLLLFIIIGFAAGSCKKFIDPGSPETGLIKETVFQSEATANGALLGIYNTMLHAGFAQDYSGIPTVTGEYTDEIRAYTTGASALQVYTNSLLPISNYTRTIWEYIYGNVYQVNSAIEGLTASTMLSTDTKNRLLAESYFVRAFLYFNLVNLYSDVPLILSTDYEITRLQGRSPVMEVYAQIMEDLNKAEAMATDDYRAGDGSVGSERIRVNLSVIEAFKARVFLYRKDFSQAEMYATKIIDKNNLFELETDLDRTFLSTSREAIWQLKPASGDYIMEGYNLTFSGAPQAGPQGSSGLSEFLVNSFSSGDKRLAEWTRENVVEGTHYFHAYKYKYASSADVAGDGEYLMVIRLAELYLIRAEARAALGNLVGANSAVSDLDIIRNRAGITDPITATTFEDIMEIIENERRLELFTEWGHRFYDLKRWPGKTDPNVSRIDEVMPAVSAAKGGDWAPFEKWFPIPQNEITKAPSLTQNDGY